VVERSPFKSAVKSSILLTPHFFTSFNMPQLDFVSFVNQIFWLSLVFVFFYLYIFKNLVPFISRIIKVREMKVNKALSYANFLRGNDNKTATTSTDLMLTKVISAASTIFTLFSTQVNSWVNAEALSFNAKEVSMNKNYFTSIGFVFFQNYIVASLILKAKTVAPSKSVAKKK
jgi:hypothetical protein